MIRTNAKHCPIIEGTIKKINELISMYRDNESLVGEYMEAEELTNNVKTICEHLNDLPLKHIVSNNIVPPKGTKDYIT